MKYFLFFSLLLLIVLSFKELDNLTYEKALLKCIQIIALSAIGMLLSNMIGEMLNVSNTFSESLGTVLPLLVVGMRNL